MATKIQILLLAATVSISGCSTLALKSADEVFAQKLVGTWAGEYTENGYLTSYGEKTYYADDRAAGFIVFPASANEGTCTAVRKLSYESRWKVVDGVLVITDMIYTPASLNDDKDEVIRDKIISIDDHEAKFEDLNDHVRFVRKRVR